MELSFNNDPLAVIYNEGPWRICELSPLYNLKYTTVKLKQYASKIRQELTSSIAANTSVKYSVEIQPQPLLKYCEEDADGLMISVSASEGNKIKSYMAILLTWGKSYKFDRAVHLPYMLERGELKLGNSVRMTLQKIFDSNIKQFCFTQIQLLRFGIIFIATDKFNNNDPFTLVFRKPGAEVNDKLSFSFDVSDIRAICNGLKQEVRNTCELIQAAYQLIQNQIFSVIKLDISMLHIHELSLPTAEVKINGIVKMKTPALTNCFFTLLNCICGLDNLLHSYDSEPSSED